ncbi:hypothetical protein HK101_003565 [Irineochytrium annulatum]|nr:hypothetical protein HK101_003565 [Irineochytrium annulatum]
MNATGSAATLCSLTQLGSCQTPGVVPYAQSVALVAWSPVVLGIIDVFLMIRLRHRSSPPDAVVVRLTRLEGCSCLLVLSCVAGALALTLSAFVGVEAVVFNSLQSILRASVFIATVLYVDSILISNPLRTPHLSRRLRYFLYLLVPLTPFAIVFSTLSGLFADQGYDRASKSVGTISDIEWALTFGQLMGFVLVARWMFVRFLREVVRPRVEAGSFAAREKRRRRRDGEEFGVAWSVRKGRGKGPMPGTDEEAIVVLEKAPGTPTDGNAAGRSLAELETGLRMSIWALTWSAAGILAFLLFAGLFALAVRLLGSRPWFIFLQVLFQHG